MTGYLNSLTYIHLGGLAASAPIISSPSPLGQGIWDKSPDRYSAAARFSSGSNFPNDLTRNVLGLVTPGQAWN